MLADVLAIAKEKRYMVLDPIPQEAPEPKPMTQVYARKKVSSVLFTFFSNYYNLQCQKHISFLVDVEIETIVHK